ncbi:hypothetical protein ACP70R_005645 [Stipagrostis hirtigluma subsp. patula]
MATPVRPTLPRLEGTASPRQLPPLADDALEEIFLRIASPADLARASTACVSFRRLITDPSFLRRFPPAEEPSPSAPAARALAGVADFFDSYLPRGRGSRWFVRDVRDGRFLLENPDDDEFYYVLPELAVCCPLSQRYLLLPPLPDGFHSVDAYLVPSDDLEDASFRVVVKMRYMDELAIFIFSSGSGQWDGGTFVSWDALRLPPDGHKMNWFLAISQLHSYAYGCFYWKLHSVNKVIKFDVNNKEFSAVDLPPYFDESNIVIVEAGECMLGICSQIDNGMAPHYTIWQHGAERSNEMKMDNIIPLPFGYFYHIVGAYGGYIFILGYSKTAPTNIECFLVDIKTLKIESVGRVQYGPVYTFFGYPPFVSPRRI